MAREPRDSAPTPPPLPPSLAAEAEAMPAPTMQPFAFGCLLMRVADSGAVSVDMAVGYNHGFSEAQARTEFVQNVQRVYPGYSITKVMGQAVLPPQPPADEVVPPLAP